MQAKLQGLLDELHSELADAGELDAAAKEKLLELSREIAEAVGPDTDKTLQKDGRSRLQEAALNFESEHPRIAGILENIADTLAKLGI